MRELIVRWYQFGTFCPIMRTHGCRGGTAPDPDPFPKDCSVGQGPNGSCGPNEVWSYGAKVEPVLSSIIRFRNQVLAPYVLELGRNVSVAGVPTMRNIGGLRTI